MEAEEAEDAQDPAAETASDAVAEPVAEPTAEDSPAEASAPEMEVFYTFTWGRTRPANRGRDQRRGDGQARSGKPQGKSGPRGKPAKGDRPRKLGGKGDRGKPQGSKTYSARPPRQEKKIDPDNPFAAALMGLKDGK